MGVYVFRSLHAPLVKVGHFKGADAWGRVSRRGFNSCVCPTRIRGRVSCDDLELLGWFPSLRPRDEKAAHRAMRAAGHGAAGEWFRAACVPDVLAHLQARCPNAAGTCSLAAVRAARPKAARRSQRQVAAAPTCMMAQPPPAARQTILSFDVGVRHLAYCVVELGAPLDAPPDIIAWDCLDVTGPGKHCIDDVTDLLLSALDERFFEPGGRVFDTVLVENQPANKNPQMKSVQMVIYTYFQMLRRHAAGVGAVRLVSASRKLVAAAASGTAAAAAATTYAGRKALAVAACRAVLERHGMAGRLAQLQASSKKDDLSDCFLQAIAWWDRERERLSKGGGRKR